MNTETREQTMQKITFYLPDLTDKQLRLVAAFIRGIEVTKDGKEKTSA